MIYSNNFDFEMIQNQKQLDEYILKATKINGPMELRYLAHTAMNGEESIIAQIPHKELHYELLIPHFWNQYWLQKRIVCKGESIKSIVYKGMDKISLSLRGMKEIMTIEVPNTHPLVRQERHTKHLVQISKDYEGNFPHRTKRNFGANKPVWVSKDLLSKIFEKRTIVKDLTRDHSQLELFEIFTQKIPRPTTS